MARNWAEEWSNQETIVFEEGLWAVSKDNEQTYELKRKNKNGSYDFVELLPGRFCGRTILKDGIVIFAGYPNIEETCLFYNNEGKRIYKLSGKELSLKIEDGVCVFLERTENGLEERALFDEVTLEPLNVCEDGQMGFEF